MESSEKDNKLRKIILDHFETEAYVNIALALCNGAYQAEKPGPYKLFITTYEEKIVRSLVEFFQAYLFDYGLNSLVEEIIAKKHELVKEAAIKAGFSEDSPK